MTSARRLLCRDELLPTIVDKVDNPPFLFYVIIARYANEFVFLEEHTGGFLSDDEKDTRFILGLSPPRNGSLPSTNRKSSRAQAARSGLRAGHFIGHVLRSSHRKGSRVRHPSRARPAYRAEDNIKRRCGTTAWKLKMELTQKQGSASRVGYKCRLHLSGREGWGPCERPTANRVCHVIRDREIRAIHDKFQNGRITIREFLMKAAHHFYPVEDQDFEDQDFEDQDVEVMNRPIKEVRLSFEVLLEVPATAPVAAAEAANPPAVVAIEAANLAAVIATEVVNLAAVVAANPAAVVTTNPEVVVAVKSTCGPSHKRSKTRTAAPEWCSPEK
ncbi:hypothetical protein DAPPUDRAFT_106797 [Daphnia pulex]|uniref:Uncharacterized protein n=1 Tax=Daphnia pulex TaxID=6669 RepID=E9GUY6_DAPPU|nr:hypothetical protein DAPPUDRAFT_106797 [Daphnia pulex]|eukprot:EFX76706.1 hypothetical protein DAPPUDRAFT_106797 [Daphnia pulex]